MFLMMIINKNVFLNHFQKYIFIQSRHLKNINYFSNVNVLPVTMNLPF